MATALGVNPLQVAPIEALLGISARVSGQPQKLVNTWGKALLVEPSASQACRGGVSILNNDGAPLQVCLSASQDGVSTRLIADPAWNLGVPAERLAASRAILEQALGQSGSEGLRPLCQGLFRTLLPTEERALNQFTVGFFWIGVGVGKPGLALYLDAKPYGVQAGWDLANRWLESVLPDASVSRPLIQQLSPHGNLASIGFEGVSPQAARAKLYWRLKQPTQLDQLGIELLGDRAFSVFLTNAIGRRRMNLSGTVMSLGFDLTTGKVKDTKIDLCGHCLPQSTRQWVDLLDHLCDEFSLPYFPVREDILQSRCEVAFIGLGVDDRRRYRLNLYLKTPNLNCLPLTLGNRDQVLRDHIDRAVNYLVDLQLSDGAWNDYQLPVGRSTQWVTAFIGLALANIGVTVHHPQAQKAAEKAAKWLLENRTYAAGWGYNETTGVDADSTAFALRLLRAMGYPIERKDELCLLQKWRPGGGFATYDGPENWGSVHPCVTAMGFLALNAEDQERLFPELCNYLSRTAQPDGTWPAYWWRNHLYSTYHHLILLRRLGLSHTFGNPVQQTTLRSTPSAFELAFAVGIESFRDVSSTYTKMLLTQLLNQQKPDGRWPGGYNLRVTAPTCAYPWEAPEGELYQDIFGGITSASVLFVLEEMFHVH